MVHARRHIRRMRGETCPHLMLADDDQYYVVKFSNNPQHRRVLVNEVVCYELLKHLDLPTPAWRQIEVSDTLIRSDPNLRMPSGASCAPGIHFASRFPVDPTLQAVYDYIPAVMRQQLQNRSAFLGMLAFDKWVGNTDCRQAIYYRARGSLLSESRSESSECPQSKSLVYRACFIDHGLAFEGRRWRFADGSAQGVCAFRDVYEQVSGVDSFEPWLSKIVQLPRRVLEEALSRVPDVWRCNDASALKDLSERLFRRCNRVAGLLIEARAVEPGLFPNWPAIDSKRATAVT